MRQYQLERAWRGRKQAGIGFAVVAGCLMVLMAGCSSKASSPPAPDPTAHAQLPATEVESPSPTATGSVGPPPVPTKQPVLWRWTADRNDDRLWVRADPDHVYVSYGPAGGGQGGVVALDPAGGAELWRFETGSLAFPAVSAAGRVLLGTANGDVVALDAATGALVWRADVGGAPFSAVVLGDTVVFGDGQPVLSGADDTRDPGPLHGAIHAFDVRTGEPRWQAEVGTSEVFLASIDGGLLAAGTNANGTGTVTRYSSEDGQVRWQVTTGPVSSPLAAGDNTVFVAGPQLVSLDAATGQQRWSVSPGDGSEFLNPIVNAGNVIVVTNTAGVEVRSASDGSLVASAMTNNHNPYCQPTAIAGPLVIMCGSLSRMSAEAKDVFMPIFTPQGAIWSAALSGNALYITTGIGSAPPVVLALPPPER